MKKVIALILVCVMLTGCGLFSDESDTTETKRESVTEIHSYEELVQDEFLRYPFVDGAYRYTLYDRCAIITEHLTREAHVTIPTFVMNVPVVGIGPKVFEGDTVLQTLTIGRSILRIGDSAFRNCSNLTVVDMSNSVAEIHGSAFAGCERLRSLKIPPYLLNLNNGAFADCKRLKKIIIEPAAVSGATRVVSGGVFSGCAALEAVWMPDDVVECSDDVFGNRHPNLVIYGTDRSASAKYAARHLVDFVLCQRDAFEETALNYTPLTRKTETLRVGDTLYTDEQDVQLLDVKFYDKLGALTAPEGSTIMAFVVSVTNHRSGSYVCNLRNTEVFSYKAAVDIPEFRTRKTIHLLPGSFTGFNDSVYELSANETAVMTVGVVVSLQYDHITVKFPGTDDYFVINSIEE